MTTSNDDQTTQLPKWDETTPLPTAFTTTSGQDATAEMPAPSSDLTSDPLTIFREASTMQVPADPFRTDTGAESQAGTSGAQGSQAQTGAPADSVGTGGRIAFDPASAGEPTPWGDEVGAAPGTQARAGATPAPDIQTWSAQYILGTTYPLPEAPSRGVRVGSFVWTLLVCMVGVFPITKIYITDLNLPVLGISTVALLGVILILTALFSSRTKKNPKQGAGPQAAPNPADAIRRG